MPVIVGIGAVGIAAIDVIVIGLLLAIAVWATLSIVTPLVAAFFRGVPIVGGWLAGNINAAMGAVMSALAPLVAASLGGFTWLLQVADSFSRELFFNLRSFAGESFNVAWKIVTLILPRELGLLRADLGNWITAVNQFTWQVYAQVENDFKAALGSATAALNAAIAAVNQFTWQVYAQVESDLNAARDLLTARIAAAVGAEQARAIAAERTVEGHADQLFNQAIAVGAAAEAALRNDLGAEAAALGRAINSGVRGLENELTSSNAATAATIGTLGAVVAREIEAIKDSPCMRQCEPLGQLGADLGGLDILMLFGLVAAAVHDPEATAQAVDRFASPIITELEQVARGAVGFKA